MAIPLRLPNAAPALSLVRRPIGNLVPVPSGITQTIAPPARILMRLPPRLPPLNFAPLQNLVRGSLILALPAAIIDLIGQAGAYQWRDSLLNQINGGNSSQVIGDPPFTGGQSVGVSYSLTFLRTGGSQNENSFYPDGTPVYGDRRTAYIVRQGTTQSISFTSFNDALSNASGNGYIGAISGVISNDVVNGQRVIVIGTGSGNITSIFPATSGFVFGGESNVPYDYQFVGAIRSDGQQDTGGNPIGDSIGEPSTNPFPVPQVAPQPQPEIVPSPLPQIQPQPLTQPLQLPKPQIFPQSQPQRQPQTNPQPQPNPQPLTQPQPLPQPQTIPEFTPQPLRTPQPFPFINPLPLINPVPIPKPNQDVNRQSIITIIGDQATQLLRNLANARNLNNTNQTNRIRRLNECCPTDLVSIPVQVFKQCNCRVPCFETVNISVPKGSETYISALFFRVAEIEALQCQDSDCDLEIFGAVNVESSKLVAIPSGAVNVLVSFSNLPESLGKRFQPSDLNIGLIGDGGNQSLDKYILDALGTINFGFKDLESSDSKVYWSDDFRLEYINQIIPIPETIKNSDRFLYVWSEYDNTCKVAFMKYKQAEDCE